MEEGGLHGARRRFQIAITDLKWRGGRELGEGQDPVVGERIRGICSREWRSIFLIDAQTGARTTLISGLGRASEPTWSRALKD